MDDRLTFFQEFLKHPLQVASIIPSSRFLERSVVENAGVKSAKTIVELGAGTGGTTRAILRAMAPHATLLSIEINPRFHVVVSRIQDNRLIVHLGSAHELQEIIPIYGLEAPDVFISGIPFSTINHTSGSQILETIASLLAPGGRFVAYQISKRITTMCRPFLGPARTKMQFFNIPPLRIYQWEKNFI
jgi:phospholipid N-methyltransferase